MKLFGLIAAAVAAPVDPTPAAANPPPDAYPGAGASFAESGPSTYLVPLLPGADDAQDRQGFVRVINRSDEAAHVRIDAYDETGRHRGRVFLSIRANETAHFNSRDLEEGNPSKRLGKGVGPGEGFWRLQVWAELNLEVLSYIRTEDGFLTSMHDVAPSVSNALRVPIFNPGSNIDQVSHLRLINLGDADSTVVIRGTDDAGESPGSAVEVSVPAGAARSWRADELESGRGVDGALGDGEGKWRLRVEPEGLVVAMSLLESPTGHLTNLSAGAVVPISDENNPGCWQSILPYFPTGADEHGRQGFLRMANVSSQRHKARIDVYNRVRGYLGSLYLQLEPGRAASLNADDLAMGNPDKGLAEGVGPGSDVRHLVVIACENVEVSGYIRTRDGFLTAMGNAVPSADGRHHVAIFNPGSNVDQVSRLFIHSPNDEPNEVRIRGVDGQGMPSGGSVKVSVGPWQVKEFTASQLEVGIEGADGALGDGSAKWQLAVESDLPIRVMSVLESAPTGIVTNLSTVSGRAAGIVRSVPENAESDQPIGRPLPLEEPDSGVTYRLEGEDADAFEIDADSGQLGTREGIVYDHETQHFYWLTLVVEDADGGETRIGVRVDVLQVLELPGQPPAPTATSVSNSSLKLRWAAPVESALPIIDYDYRYRLSGDEEDWTEVLDIRIPDTEMIVEGLTREADYEVQVRAVNEDGPGPWSEAATVRVWPPVPDVSVTGPWSMINVDMDFERAPRDFESYCMTLTLHTGLYGDLPIYIGLFGQRINKIPIYGGLQTRIDGSVEDEDGNLRHMTRDRGAIFSRWGERDLDAIRAAPGGLFASSAGESDFISARNDFAWTRGSYRLCLKTSDIVDGEPLPRDYEAGDIYFGWGRYVHTWVRLEITDLATRETTFAGALAFPGRSLALDERSWFFVEAFGTEFIDVRDVPYFELSISDLEVDGRDVPLSLLSATANLGGSHRNAPVIAKAEYVAREGEIFIRIGAFDGEFGKVETMLLP